jgi:hypothetical protein
VLWSGVQPSPPERSVVGGGTLMLWVDDRARSLARRGCAQSARVVAFRAGEPGWLVGYREGVALGAAQRLLPARGERHGPDQSVGEKAPAFGVQGGLDREGS